MDGSHGFGAQSWSAAQLEQLRKFLQPASQIPSSNSIQEVLQPATQCQPTFPGHGQQIAGTSFTNIPNTGNKTKVRGLNPVAHAVSVNPSAASSVPSSMIRPVPDGLTAIKYPAPDVKSMMFDPGTGYRFDQLTGLYYDANAGLFVNKYLNILLQWNPMTSTYSLVGRASDVAAPALAQDLARLMGHGQTTVAFSASTATPTSNPPIPSSSVRDATFKRERSLSFEEMSPDRASPSKQQPSGMNRYDEADVTGRRRSLSFEEMTPERDTDDTPSASVFPRDRSPSCDRRRGSPHRDRDSNGGRSSDEGRDSNRGRSPDGREGRDRRSPMRYYSRNPSTKPTRRRPSPEISRCSSTDRSWRRSSPKSPRRGSRLSTSPERETGRTFGPRRAPRRRFSPGVTGESKEKRGGRRFNRSPSSTHQFARREKNDYTERGRTPRKKSRSRSRSAEIRNIQRRSPSRSKTNEDSAPTRSSVQNDTPSEGSRQVSNATNACPTSGSGRGFSDSFIVENINRIHRKNLRKPGNTYGHIFPTHSVITLFIMLTPLPHQGDRKWDDLETLLKANLINEGVTFHSVTIYPGDGGAPCNYCLVRFKEIEEAFRWYMTNEGIFQLSNPDGSTCPVFMHFIHNNWRCNDCKEMNFALRRFCHKCFWFSTQSRKPPIQKSQLVTQYVGISGFDCRFLTVEEVLVGLPPLDGFDVETFEFLTESSGIPLGLVVFKFKEQSESAAFYRFLQESSLNPYFINIVDRTGLGVNPIPGTLLKDIASSVSTNRVVPEPIVQVPTIPTVVFPNPPDMTPDNRLLWWQFVEGYDPDGDMMKYLFEEHQQVNIVFESAHAQILLGPLPLPVAFDVMEYRDLLCQFLCSTGVSTRNTERTAICRAHHFGAPYNYSMIRFDAKNQAKEWLEKNNGKLVLHLEDGSTWPVYLHYAKPNWPCQYCKKFNFPIRIQCFSCYKARLSDHTPVTIMKNPTNSIGITGFQSWCATKDLLFAHLCFLREIKNLAISYLKEPTGVPLGICVLKSSTVYASEVLFNKLQDALMHELAKASVQEPNRPLLTYIM